MWPAKALVVVLGLLVSPQAQAAPQPSEGIELVRVGDRDHPRVRLADGRWWYVAPGCPWPSSEIPRDAVCGGDQVLLRDDADLRCTFVVTHRAEVTPSRVTWRFCLSRPPLSPEFHWSEEQNRARIAQLRTAIGACVGTEQVCLPMQWWPRRSDGGIDCGRIPADRLGDALAVVPHRVGMVCAVLDSYLLERPLPAVTAADLNLVGRAVADGVPVGGGTAATVGGGVLGDSLDAACSIPALVATLGGLCVGAVAVEAGASLWGVMDCGREFDKCLAEAAARSMLAGLDLTLGALRNPTPVKFDDPGLRTVLGAAGTVSAYLLLALLLVNAVIAVVRMRLRELAESGIGLVRWAFGLGAGLAVVASAVFVSDRVADWLAGSTAGTAEAVYARFFGLMRVLAAGGPDVQFHGWLLVMVVFLLGAFCAGVAYLLLVFRSGAIVLAVTLLVLQLAGGAGPAVTRSWTRKGLSVLWACVVAKPVSVLVFRLGETWIGEGRGVGDLLVGVGMLGVASLAPFVVVKWFPLDGGRGGSGRGSVPMVVSSGLAMAGSWAAPRSASVPDRAPAVSVRPLPAVAAVGALAAMAVQSTVDGVVSGGADESPFPDQVPWVPPPVGPTSGGGRW
ncbi:hypothetical protein GCM10022243_13630 [Saccharothrix violaceirubra]|uniref:TrbL/VirB6 plasmid conjugal transfer protein n=1 Tax=Saccharothrix violaceirubra TaxID=413306 RepID=A0A7W7SYX3_9PSEU|nr:hypothetical protein [Saccharothrix violaceirubra]MBB4963517.1 hypothetical protein [Saccharothrix violaceirubra]